jgi:hypothetical protein
MQLTRTEFVGSIAGSALCGACAVFLVSRRTRGALAVASDAAPVSLEGIVNYSQHVLANSRAR